MFNWITNSAEALNILKTATLISTGLVGVALLLRSINLLVDFKSKPKEQKVKDTLSVIAALCVIGIFWSSYILWGVPIASGYN